MKGKKVLVETRNMMNDLWFPDYEGEVLKETESRYLVRHHFIFREWLPKNAWLCRCTPILEQF